MQNFIQPGETLTLTVDRAVNSGGGFLAGAIFGVATADVADTEAGEFNTRGVYALAKTSAQAWDVGDKIYWDDTAHECTTDGTAGQLIGAATAVAANPSSTGYVKLNDAVPSSSEGPQAAIADLVDNSGGAVADGTIGLVTAPTAITDNSGGAVADGTIGAVTPAAAITDNSGGVDPGDDIIAAITNANNAGSADVLPTSAAIAQLAAKANVTRTAVVALTDAIPELTARQGEDRTAIIALTDAVKELSTKVNTILASLRLSGLISP